MEAKKKHVSLNHIRGLVVAQRGRCAITGLPLSPQEVNADHISPVSRKDLELFSDEQNVWLVDKRVNALKGTLSYDELVQMARMILRHEKVSRTLLETIRRDGIKPVAKQDFDLWITESCEPEGRVIGGVVESSEA